MFSYHLFKSILKNEVADFFGESWCSRLVTHQGPYLEPSALNRHCLARRRFGHCLGLQWVTSNSNLHHARNHPPPTLSIYQSLLLVLIQNTSSMHQNDNLLNILLQLILESPPPTPPPLAASAASATQGACAAPPPRRGSPRDRRHGSPPARPGAGKRPCGNVEFRYEKIRF